MWDNNLEAIMEEEEEVRKHRSITSDPPPKKKKERPSLKSVLSSLLPSYEQLKKGEWF